MQELKYALKKLTFKKNIYFTKKGDQAIELVLKNIKSKKEINIQKYGGWKTYPFFANKCFNKVKYLNLKKWQVKTTFNTKGVILINSMPAYSALQNMNKIPSNLIIINDVSGSIGTKHATKGDYIIGSFGRWKPVSINSCGFIATNELLKLKEYQLTKKEQSLLLKELNNIKSKKFKWSLIKKNLKKDLINYKIISKPSGINLLILIKKQKQKETLIKYLEKHKYEYIVCPNYTRINKKAISIEIKRCL